VISIDTDLDDLKWPWTA